MVTDFLLDHQRKANRPFFLLAVVIFIYPHGSRAVLAKEFRGNLTIESHVLEVKLRPALSVFASLSLGGP